MDCAVLQALNPRRRGDAQHGTAAERKRRAAERNRREAECKKARRRADGLRHDANPELLARPVQERGGSFVLLRQWKASLFASTLGRDSAE